MCSINICCTPTHTHTHTHTHTELWSHAQTDIHRYTTPQKVFQKEHRRDTRNSKPVVYFALKPQEDNPLWVFSLLRDKTTSSLATHYVPDWGGLELKLSPAGRLLATSEWILTCVCLTVSMLHCTRPLERLRQSFCVVIPWQRERHSLFFLQYNILIFIGLVFESLYLICLTSFELYSFYTNADILQNKHLPLRLSDKPWDLRTSDEYFSHFF